MEETSKEQPAGSSMAAAGAQADSVKPVEEKKADEPKPADASAKKEGGASKPGMKRVVRPGAGPRAPRDPNAPPPAPQKSTAKAIVMFACVVLFLACVGTGVYIAFFKPKGGKPEVVQELHPEAQKLVDTAKQAETLYIEAKEKVKSKEKADLEFAKERMEKALPLITQVLESQKTVKGQEKLINKVIDLNGVIDKELGTVRKKLVDIEDQERVDKHRKEQANKPPETATPAPAGRAAPEEPAKPGEDGTIPGTKGLKLKDFSKAVMDDLKEGNPSEFEFRTELIKKLKIEVPKE